MKKKLIVSFLLISSLAFSDKLEKNKINLYQAAKLKGYKKQIYIPDNIYKIYTKPQIGTAIMFSKKEQLLSVTFGDPAFWNSIMIGNQLIVQPVEENLTTNMFVTTNVRDYFFEVRSPNEDIFNGVVEFIYPQETIDFNLKQQRMRNEELKLKVANIEDLNFNYRYKKIYPWSPKTVFDDGEKTYIELSEKDKDVPSFYMKKDGELSMVMTRIFIKENGRKVIVVDRVFEEGILALNKKQIIIFNKNKRK